MVNGGSELAARLRAETEVPHLEAERTGYVKVILKRQASKEGYGLFLRNLLPAYHTLEQALAGKARHAALELFDWPPLFRSQAIAADLQALAGPDWSRGFLLLPEGQAYADRIEKVAAKAPDRLIAHAYVRYVGDLSGGQIVRRLLSRSPGLRSDMLGFYEFPGINDADAYKDGFRDRLNQAGTCVDDADGIIDEAVHAFRLNIDLSEAVLEASLDACPASGD